MRAEAAPSIVTSPKTSVSKTLVLSDIRFPTKTPIDAPPTIVRIFMTVPIPGNIAAGYADLYADATTSRGLDYPDDKEKTNGFFSPP